MTRKPRRSMRVEIRGKVYDSVKEAAADQGVKIDTIYRAIEKGDTSKVGLGLPHTNGPKPLELYGVKFPSYTAASKALGCNPSYVSVVMSQGKPGAHIRLKKRIEAYKKSIDAPGKKP